MYGRNIGIHIIVRGVRNLLEKFAVGLEERRALREVLEGVAVVSVRVRVRLAD